MREPYICIDYRDGLVGVGHIGLTPEEAHWPPYLVFIYYVVMSSSNSKLLFEASFLN